MNKYLALFCFVLLCNYTFCKDCTEASEGCDKSQIDNPNDYVCVEVSDNTCGLKLYCDVAVNEGNDENFKCSDQPVKTNGKTCFDNEEGAGNPCKEEYACNDVTNAEEGTCPSYPVTDKNKYHCVPGDENSCTEEPYCTHATTEDCSTLTVAPSKSTTHVCIPGDGDTHCVEEYLCEKLTKEAKESSPTEISCSNLILSKENRDKETHICIDNEDEESTKACKEVKKCSQVTSSDTDKDCSHYGVESQQKVCVKKTGDNAQICEEKYKCNNVPVNEDGQCKDFLVSDNDHVCVDNTGDSTKCIEKLLCSKVPKPENNANSIDCSSTDYQISEANKNTHICVQDPDSQNYACKEEFLCNEATNAANDEECNKYPVVPAKKTTHVCIKDPTQSKCKEEFLCESVARGDSVQCSNYPVKIANKATHECIQSRNPEKACQEAKFCALNTEGTSDEQCRRYPITKENIGKKACIKKEASGAMGCVEKDLCTTITKGTEVDCSKYPVSDEKMKNHICKAVDGNDKCSEVEISCLEATKGESDEQCSNYKVSDLDPNKKCAKNTDTSAGATPCTEVSKSACELKTTGATDDVCNGLAVSKTVEQICIKNPEGNNCLQLTYCEYGIGIDDYDCAKYALKNKEKVCKKKAGSNKCEEVEKTNEDDGGNNGGGNKGNKGSFLNLSFGLLLIISIL